MCKKESMEVSIVLKAEFVEDVFFCRGVAVEDVDDFMRVMRMIMPEIMKERMRDIMRDVIEECGEIYVRHCDSDASRSASIMVEFEF